MQHLTRHDERTLRAPSDARELLLAFDPSRLDVPQAVRRAAGLWASHWMEAEPDALILMACNARARNREAASRSLRLRRLAAELERRGVPRDRIRYTARGTLTPACAQAGERGLAWIKVLRPHQLETDVRSIDCLFADTPVDAAGRVAC